ncbi:MAG: hypothetical protein QOF98_2833 [Streptomyces sp.]|nr:hypothetical protein [Streptomyces sp.]
MRSHDNGEYGSAPDGQDPQPGQGDAYGQGYGPEYGQNYGQEYVSPDPYGQQGGYGVPAPQGDPYVPEPMAGQLPPQADPGAAYGVPAGGGAWAGDPYSGPVAGGGWDGAAPAGTWEHAGPGGGYGYEGQQQWSQPQAQAQPPSQPHAQPHFPADHFLADQQPAPQPPYQPGHQPQPGSQPHAYADPFPYAQAEPHAQTHAQPHAQPHGPAHAAAQAGPDPQSYARNGTEQTAVLPVIEDVPAQSPAHGNSQGNSQGTAQGPAPAVVRTGSPIIPPGIQPAGLTAALGLLLAGGAAIGKPGLTVFLVVLQAVTAAGWFRLNGMWPARQGIMLAFLSGVTADIALLAVDGEHASLALAGTLGVWLLLVLVLQLRHHGSADERLSSLTATSASTLLTVLAACYLAAATSHAGTDPVVVGAIAVAAATLVRALPLPGGEPVSLLLAVAVATATGLGTGSATGFGSGPAALLAAVCGACALVGLRAASYDWPSRFVHFTAGVALPLTAAAPLVYALGRLLS